MRRRHPACLLILLNVLLSAVAVSASVQAEDSKRPNFLFCISDDQSYWHTGITGDPVVKTPAFDRVAREGVLFTNAHCNASSCSPSRAAILTGRNPYELESGGVINASLPARFADYQTLLYQAGYWIGYTGKGWSPGEPMAGGRLRNPAGFAYRSARRSELPKQMGPDDYVRNFEAFLDDVQDGQPFSFWFAPTEPHRPYQAGIGIQQGLNPDDVQLPPFLPDTPGVRSDFCDYLYEIQYFDKQLGCMLELLEDRGQLDNTVVVVTSDNGMPFPCGKSNLYTAGTHMPLAVMWRQGIQPGRHVNDLVTLASWAPTFLELAGVTVPPEMNHPSLSPLLKSGHSGRILKQTTAVVMSHEVHNVPYPMRAIRTNEYLYIWNCEPHRLKFPKEEGYIWSANLRPSHLRQKLSQTMGPSALYGAFREDPYVQPFVEMAFGQRPPEQLFDLKTDPYNLINVAEKPDYQHVLKQLQQQLHEYLERTGDPRAHGGPADFTQFQAFTTEVRQARADQIRSWRQQMHKHQRTAIQLQTGNGR